MKGKEKILKKKLPLKVSAICTYIIFLACYSFLSAQIPYQEALDNAAVTQSSIDNINTKAMVIGNGDINALVSSAGNDIMLTVSKHDV